MVPCFMGLKTTRGKIEDEARKSDAVIPEPSPMPLFKPTGEESQGKKARDKRTGHPDQARAQQMDQVTGGSSLLMGFEKAHQFLGNGGWGDHHGKGKAELLDAQAGYPQKHPDGDRGSGAGKSAERKAESL